MACIYVILQLIPIDILDQLYHQSVSENAQKEQNFPAAEANLLKRKKRDYYAGRTCSVINDCMMDYVCPRGGYCNTAIHPDQCVCYG